MVLSSVTFRTGQERQVFLSKGVLLSWVLSSICVRTGASPVSLWTSLPRAFSWNPYQTDGRKSRKISLSLLVVLLGRVEFSKAFFFPPQWEHSCTFFFLKDRFPASGRPFFQELWDALFWLVSGSVSPASVYTLFMELSGLEGPDLHADICSYFPFGRRQACCLALVCVCF